MEEVYDVSFPALGLLFKIKAIAFEIFDMQVRFYGLIFAFACILGLVYVMLRAKDFDLNREKLIDIIFLSLIFGIIGARLYYIVFYPDIGYYFKNPLRVFYLNQGGIAIYGGIIGSLLPGVIMCRKRNIKILPALDLVSIGLILGQCIGRWGNFFNQEAFGTQTDLPWGMKSQSTDGIAVHPCFFYESIWCFLGFLMFHILSFRFRKYQGRIFSYYLIWYGFGRLFIEQLRTDSLLVPGVPWLRISQIISLFSVLLGTIMIIVLKRKNLNNFFRNEKIKKFTFKNDVS